MLTARRLAFRYGARTVLSDIDLTVEPGEIIALVGPNGAGKSTLLRALAGLARVSAGRVGWFGQSGMGPALRRRIGFLPDEAALFDELTGLENLLLFAGIRRQAAVCPTHCTLLAGSLGLSQSELQQPAGTYSFGMRRKLAIAQTFVGQPPLLLLDEPTLGLDPIARDLLAAELRIRSAHSATVLASNDLRFVQEYCHRVLFLADARLVLQGRPADLLEPFRGHVEFLITTRADYQAIQFPDFVETRLDGGAVAFRSERGAALLPALIDALIRRGNEIETIEVRRPDLSDVLRAQTGSNWRTSWPPQ
jgi:ABC-2 type transport system ATP-binding protein